VRRQRELTRPRIAFKACVGVRHLAATTGGTAAAVTVRGKRGWAAEGRGRRHEFERVEEPAHVLRGPQRGRQIPIEATLLQQVVQDGNVPRGFGERSVEVTVERRDGRRRRRYELAERVRRGDDVISDVARLLLTARDGSRVLLRWSDTARRRFKHRAVRGGAVGDSC
jgi:hypothetical protein